MLVTQRDNDIYKRMNKHTAWLIWISMNWGGARPAKTEQARVVRQEHKTATNVKRARRPIDSLAGTPGFGTSGGADCSISDQSFNAVRYDTFISPRGAWLLLPK